MYLLDVLTCKSPADWREVAAAHGLFGCRAVCASACVVWRHNRAWRWFFFLLSRLLFVPTSSVTGLYVGFMNPAVKQSLAGFNPGNIFKLRLACRCLLWLARRCFVHAALQSSPPVLFILLRYLSVDLYIYIYILSFYPQKKKRKNQGWITRGNLFGFALLLPKKETTKKPYNSTLSNTKLSPQLRARTLRAAWSHTKEKEAKRHLSENVSAECSLILCNSQRLTAK